jgi:hypothetical protein
MSIRANVNPGKRQSANRAQIDRRIFAAAIDFNVKFNLVAFAKIAKTGAFNRRDVNEHIGLSIITLNKAEALHRIEEFDNTRGLFASEFALGASATAARSTTEASSTTAAAEAATIRAIRPLRAFATLLHRQRFAVDLQIGCRNFAAPVDQCIFERLSVSEACKASLFDRRNMHENIRRAVFRSDKTKALARIEEFDCTLAFANHLGWHLRTRGTATSAKATAAAAAKAISTAATATKAITAAAAGTETAAAATKAISTAAAKAITATTTAAVIAEAFKPVASAPSAITAPSFIETHAA